MISARYWLGSLLLFLVAGCGTRTLVPEDRFYQLEPVPSPVSLARPVFPHGLDVETVGADPLRSGRAVLYRHTRRPLEIRRYHYEFWVDQPPRMVHRALLHYLRASGVADPVREGGRRGRADYALKAKLKRFDRLVGAGAPKVEVELEATVYANGSGQALWTSSYLQRQDSNGGDMHATAAAMQTALANIFQSMLEDLGSIDLAR